VIGTLKAAYVYGLVTKDELTLTTTAPRSRRAWTGDGTSHERRALKLRHEGAVRVVPIPPRLVTLLREHIATHGTATGGRLFASPRGGLLHESCYGGPATPPAPGTPCWCCCRFTRTACPATTRSPTTRIEISLSPLAHRWPAKAALRDRHRPSAMRP
jgi:hypothetical protein